MASALPVFVQIVGVFLVIGGLCVTLVFFSGLVELVPGFVPSAAGNDIAEVVDGRSIAQVVLSPQRLVKG